ncbi:hypothetical protein Scep_030277 [Stephania cephalantha]|uniref:Uncharacterized protein n=1 Tax=Stephania cephalantha TaxID=152367 RepID=A0AAP0HGQ7_9MAGN
MIPCGIDLKRYNKVYVYSARHGLHRISNPNLEEIVINVPLKSVEVNEVTQIEDYWSKTTEEHEVSPTEPNIIIAQDEDEENEMKVEVTSKRSEELPKQSKEDQHLVLVKPPTLPCTFVESYMGGKVLNELPSLKEGVHVSLPKAIDAPFVVDISKGEVIT